MSEVLPAHLPCKEHGAWKGISPILVYIFRFLPLPSESGDIECVGKKPEHPLHFGIFMERFRIRNIFGFYPVHERENPLSHPVCYERTNTEGMRLISSTIKHIPSFRKERCPPDGVGWFSFSVFSFVFVNLESCILHDGIDSFSYLLRDGDIGKEHDIVRIPSIHPLFFPAELRGYFMVEPIIGDHIGEDGTRWSSLRKPSFVTCKPYDECNNIFQIIRINRFLLVLEKRIEFLQQSFLSPLRENRRKEVSDIDLIYSRYDSRFLWITFYIRRSHFQNSPRPIGIALLPKWNSLLPEKLIRHKPKSRIRTVFFPKSTDGGVPERNALKCSTDSRLDFFKDTFYFFFSLRSSYFPHNSSTGRRFDSPKSSVCFRNFKHPIRTPRRIPKDIIRFFQIVGKPFYLVGIEVYFRVCPRESRIH